MRALPRVEIVVEPETLERSAQGGITGRVWLRDGSPEAQEDFPEVGWSDFPVAILAAWSLELQRLARSIPAADTPARCRFMDGPYSFAVHAEEAGAWRITCSEDRTTGRSAPGPRWLTDQASFLDSLHRAARSVLSFCDARGWWNEETEALRRRMEAGGGT
jgi:hypothetical protein